MTVEPETLETVRASRNRMLETWRAVEAALYGGEHQVGLYSFLDTHRGVVELIEQRDALLEALKSDTQLFESILSAAGESCRVLLDHQTIQIVRRKLDAARKAIADVEGKE